LFPDDRKRSSARRMRSLEEEETQGRIGSTPWQPHGAGRRTFGGIKTGQPGEGSWEKNRDTV
jgi:hypothetical protein